MIILEGVHWSTDFSIFDEFQRDGMPDNIMLQFHKYWNNPDKESMKYYLDYQDKLDVPLFMGEGGENNLEWYTMLFPLYERLNISWSFWTYKKMECTNSPVTFHMPNGWEDLIDFIDGKRILEKEEAIKIFDNSLHSLSTPKVNKEVLFALKRQVPVIIPCEGYDDYNIVSKRRKGANLRESDPVTLLFEMVI